MRYRILLLAALGACGGASPKTTVDPARGLRAMTTEDPELSSIAVAAARALPAAAPSSTTPFFGGVFLDGRRSRPASDAVGRATGLQVVSGSPRRVQMRCEARSSSGQVREIPCPPQAKQAIPPVFTFDEVRATADSAYVGVTEATDAYSKASCLTLVRQGAGWNYLGTTVIANARHCGR